MSAIFVRCPVTRKPVSTGVDLKDIDPLLMEPQEMYCIYCDQIHVWVAKDVIFFPVISDFQNN